MGFFGIDFSRPGADFVPRASATKVGEGPSFDVLYTGGPGASKWLSCGGSDYAAAMAEGKDPYSLTLIWAWAPAPSLEKSVGVDRMRTLIDFVNSHTWPVPATLSMVQKVASELRVAAAEREKETDATFKKFTDYASSYVPAEYLAYVKIGYSAWKKIGGMLNGHDGDSEEQIARLDASVQSCLAAGFPPPWKIFEGAVSATAESLANRVDEWTARCRALPSDLREDLRAWWAAWLFYANDPAFEAAFSSPLLSRSGCITDGLVVLASMPFAKSKNLPLADVAGRVWTEASPGGNNQVLALARAAQKARVVTGSESSGSTSLGTVATVAGVGLGVGALAYFLL